MTQARLAELLGRSPSTIRGWERGASRPRDRETLEALAVVLGVADLAGETSSGEEAVGAVPHAYPPASPPGERNAGLETLSAAWRTARRRLENIIPRRSQGALPVEWRVARTRMLMTVAAFVGLLLILKWSAGNAGEILSSLWEAFREGF